MCKQVIKATENGWTSITFRDIHPYLVLSDKLKFDTIAICHRGIILVLQLYNGSMICVCYLDIPLCKAKREYLLT